MGRSPRARGRPGGRLPSRAATGPIPACAGKTPGKEECRRRARADPRVRGEDEKCKRCSSLDRGRSPRARGRQSVQLGRERRKRPIPACAGKTPSSWTTKPCQRADPRVRGEDLVSSAPWHPHPGRSPRARGRHPDITSVYTWARPIPACAGKTSSMTTACRSCQADPRVRGEDAKMSPSSF